MSTPNLQRKVLIIDDNFDAAEMLCTLLCMRGHCASFEIDGPSGIAAAKSVVPDLILLDIGMPLMDGFQVANEIRNSPELASCMVVALTAWNDEQTKAKAYSSGFHAHIAKPTSMERLTAQLRL